MRQTKEGMKEREWPGSRRGVARGGRQRELASLGLGFPLSLGCFPCLHSIRGLAKKFCTRRAAWAAVRQRCAKRDRSGSEGGPLLRPTCGSFLQVVFCYAGMESSRKSERAGERGERPLPNSLPFPLRHRVPAAPLPPFLPSCTARRLLLLLCQKKRNITSRDLPSLAWVPKAPETFWKHR